MVQCKKTMKKKSKVQKGGFATDEEYDDYIRNEPSAEYYIMMEESKYQVENELISDEQRKEISDYMYDTGLNMMMLETTDVPSEKTKYLADWILLYDGSDKEETEKAYNKWKSEFLKIKEEDESIEVLEIHGLWPSNKTWIETLTKFFTKEMKKYAKKIKKIKDKQVKDKKKITAAKKKLQEQARKAAIKAKNAAKTAVEKQKNRKKNLFCKNTIEFITQEDIEDIPTEDLVFIKLEKSIFCLDKDSFKNMVKFAADQKVRGDCDPAIDGIPLNCKWFYPINIGQNIYISEKNYNDFKKNHLDKKKFSLINKRIIDFTTGLHMMSEKSGKDTVYDLVIDNYNVDDVRTMKDYSKGDTVRVYGLTGKKESWNGYLAKLYAEKSQKTGKWPLKLLKTGEKAWVKEANFSIYKYKDAKQTGGKKKVKKTTKKVKKQTGGKKKVVKKTVAKKKVNKKSMIDKVLSYFY